MNANLARLAWVVGLTAVLLLAGIHSLISAVLRFVMEQGTAETIGFFVILALASVTLIRNRLVERVESPPWVFGAMAAIGLAVLIGRDVYGVLPSAIASTSSTTCCALWATTSSPQTGQWGTPMRAYSRRR